MDAVDHLFSQLVDALRRERAGALRDRYTVRALYEDLIPYRRVRDAAGFRSNGDYEVALSRLLAGEGGFLASSSKEMSEALRAGLAEPVPDARRYRSFAGVEVWIETAVIPPSGSARYAPPELRPSEEELAERLPGDAVEPPGLWGDAEDESRGGGGEERPGRDTSDAVPAEVSSDAHDVGGTGGFEGERSPGAEELEDVLRCPSCDSELPQGAIRYCPYCGTAIVDATCEGCGADLEPGWRFCPACGRPRGRGPDSA